MKTKAENRLLGASVSEQELYDLLLGHEHDESEVIAAYKELADQTRSETVRYLITLIVEDEERHHRVLEELANRVKSEATFRETSPQVPAMDLRRSDRELLEATKRFIAFERVDRRRLRGLARGVNGLGSELGVFLVDMLRADTNRHIRTLKFIKHLLRDSALPEAVEATQAH